jgi:hypothetical protein
MGALSSIATRCRETRRTLSRLTGNATSSPPADAGRHVETVIAREPGESGGRPQHRVWNPPC